MGTPKHPRARHFEKEGLFGNLAAFRDLESRIAALATERERGDAFEVFAEAYLATQKHTQATEVWPFATLPRSKKRTLRLGGRADMGVDGVFTDAFGQDSAYQVKFRTGRPALGWKDLSTFMGLADADQVVGRVVLTNSWKIPPVMNDRRGVICICGGDLDRLDRRDLRAAARRGRLSDERKVRLDALGFQWAPYESDWAEAV